MLADLLNSGNFEHIYVVARWFYKNGQSIVSNEAYEAMEDYLKETDPDFNLHTVSYESDVEPIHLLEHYDIECNFTEAQETSMFQKYKNELVENSSISITPVRSPEAAYEWFESVSGIPLCASLKVDGVNSKHIFDKSTKIYLAGSSRGRDGRELKDFTLAGYQKFDGHIELHDKSSTGDNIIAYAEAYVDKEGIQYMKEYTGEHDKFVTARSSALSLLQVSPPPEVMKHLHFLIFKLKNYGSSLFNTLKELRINGYETPYFEEVLYEHMSFDEFKVWIDDILDRFNQRMVGDKIPCDGVVFEIDNQIRFNLMDSTTMYSTGNIAVKFGPWQAKSFTAKVKKIVIESTDGTKETKSVRLKIEPTIVSGGETVTIVNAYNLGYVQRLGILPGTTISFVHQSQAIGVLEGVVNNGS